MRKLLAVSFALAASACNQNVKVPTTNELLADPKLLAEWQMNCDTGEYSHLPADQKQNLCFNSQEAARSIAIKKMNGI